LSDPSVAIDTFTKPSAFQKLILCPRHSIHRADLPRLTHSTPLATQSSSGITAAAMNSDARGVSFVHRIITRHAFGPSHPSPKENFTTH
jgi:hypothetical protein